MKNFIKIYNDSVNVDSQFKMSPDELFLWSYLYVRRKYENITETNIDILDQRLKFQSGNDRKNKTYIYQLLQSLMTMGYIQIDELNKKSAFIVSFKDDVSYGAIPFSVYREFNDPIEFYIYAYIDMFGDKGRDISDDTWVKLLNYFVYDENLKHGVIKKFYSRSKIRSIINKMLEDGKIYKISGTYYQDNGKIKQGTNTYFTRPNEKTLKKIEIFNKKINKDKQIKEIVKKESSISPVNVDSPFHPEYPHRWKEYGTRLDIKDLQYYLLWKDKDDEFRRVADKRIEVISKTKEGKYAITKQLEEAEEINRRIIQRQKDEQRKIEEENLFNKIKNSQRTIISLVDGSIVEMNENILLSQIKYIYYINNEKIEKISIHDLMEGRKFTLSNQEKIDNKIMEIITNRQFTSKHIQEIREWMYSIMSKENEGKELDEEWEGDIYSFNGEREINDSLKERLYRMKKSLICQ